MSREQKKKISAFEFVIMQIADKDEAEKYTPFTKEEETQQRVNHIKSQMSKIKIKKSC